MNRRDFLSVSALAGLTSLVPSPKASAQGATGKQLLELRTYHFESTAQRDAFDRFLARSAVPALERAGIRPVGVFRLDPADNPKLEDGDPRRLFVLMPHSSPESFILMLERLSRDPTFVESGSDVLDAPKSSPAYQRFESSLMLAFDLLPRVEVPTKAARRVLQLRIYESHSQERALKKIEMFNEGGEIRIFRDCAMHPVFFGQTLIGDRLPNLTYMLSFEDEAAMKKGWDAFRGHPDWAQLRSDPAYRDTVSRITNIVLRPTASSRI